MTSAREYFDRPPVNEITREKFAQLRQEFGIFAEVLEALLPESPEAAKSVELLWNSYTYANLAVGLHTVRPVNLVTSSETQGEVISEVQ